MAAVNTWTKWKYLKPVSYALWLFNKCDTMTTIDSMPIVHLVFRFLVIGIGSLNQEIFILTVNLKTIPPPNPAPYTDNDMYSHKVFWDWFVHPELKYHTLLCNAFTAVRKVGHSITFSARIVWKQTHISKNRRCLGKKIGVRYKKNNAELSKLDQTCQVVYLVWG